MEPAQYKHREGRVNFKLRLTALVSFGIVDAKVRYMYDNKKVPNKLNAKFIL